MKFLRLKLRINAKVMWKLKWERTEISVFLIEINNQSRWLIRQVWRKKCNPVWPSSNGDKLSGKLSRKLVKDLVIIPWKNGRSVTHHSLRKEVPNFKHVMSNYASSNCKNLFGSRLTEVEVRSGAEETLLSHQHKRKDTQGSPNTSNKSFIIFYRIIIREL